MVINQIENFSHEQSYCQTNQENWLVVNLWGLEEIVVEMPSGGQLQISDHQRPFVLFLPVQGRFDFVYGKKRDNWVVKLPKDAMKERSPDEVELFLGGSRLFVPAFHVLNRIQAEKCRTALKKLLHSFHRPSENRDGLLWLSFSVLLETILAPDLPSKREDPVENLRQKIVDDRHFSKTLSSLSQECGYSSDHLRRVFEGRFGIAPKVFREKYRMDIARSFLNMGTPIKQVSEELGYSYPAHFSNAFKKAFGVPPSSEYSKEK